MNNLNEIFEKSKKNMVFKELDFFRKLNEKQIKSLFYPGLILNMANYTGYSEDDAKELALLSHLLYFSIEIHEKILEDEDVNNLVILEGDHIYSGVFKKITRSVHINNISKFINYIKNISKKRIMFIDGIFKENEVTEYKYKQISKIVMEIIAEDNDEIMEIALKLSDLYIIYIKEDREKFLNEKNSIINYYKNQNNEKMFRTIKNIIYSMEGLTSEQ